MSTTNEDSASANVPLRDWGNSYCPSPTQVSTSDSNDTEIDSGWAKIANLSRKRWYKENPY